jgi:hypothetical protein
MRAPRRGFVQYRACCLLRATYDRVQLLIVQFNRLESFAGCLPDDFVLRLLVHDLASEQGSGRNCLAAHFIPIACSTETM